jgi:hypothetical protein
MAWRFTCHVTSGEPVQLLVYKGNEFYQGLLICHARSLEQSSCFMRINIRQTILKVNRVGLTIYLFRTGHKKTSAGLQFSRCIFALDK